MARFVLTNTLLLLSLGCGDKSGPGDDTGSEDAGRGVPADETVPSPYTSADIHHALDQDKDCIPDFIERVLDDPD